MRSEYIVSKGALDRPGCRLLAWHLIMLRPWQLLLSACCMHQITFPEQRKWEGKAASGHIFGKFIVGQRSYRNGQVPYLQHGPPMGPPVTSAL